MMNVILLSTLLLFNLPLIFAQESNLDLAYTGSDANNGWVDFCTNPKDLADNWYWFPGINTLRASDLDFHGEVNMMKLSSRKEIEYESSYELKTSIRVHIRANAIESVVAYYSEDTICLSGDYYFENKAFSKILHIYNVFMIGNTEIKNPIIKPVLKY
jgi:hypothetical protein